jgi:hypothetical protein
LLERQPVSAATAGIPVLVLSTSPRLLEHAREQESLFGNHRYLDRQFDVDALLDHIRQMIGKA